MTGITLLQTQLVEGCYRYQPETNFTDIFYVHFGPDKYHEHYDDVIMSTIAPQITSLAIVYLTIYSGADQSKHQSSASLAFVWGIHRGPVNSPHKWPVTRKMFPFDDVIMGHIWLSLSNSHVQLPFHMMMSTNGNISLVTGPLNGKFTGHQLIPLTKASDAELWCFLLSAPEQTVEWTIETLIVWDATTLIMTSLWWVRILWKLDAGDLPNSRTTHMQAKFHCV